MGFFDNIGNMFGFGHAKNAANYSASAPQFWTGEDAQGYENKAQDVENMKNSQTFAQALMNQSTEKQTAQANALANSAKGGVNPALLQRQVMQQAGQASQAGAQQSMIGGMGYQQNQEALAQKYREMGIQGAEAQASANLQAQGINAQLAAANTKEQTSGIGGLFNAVTGGLGMSSIFKSGGGGGSSGLFSDMGSNASMAAMASEGGKVSGTPTVDGDSEKNDTVPAMLSPGEIVVPRSAAHDPEKAKEFIDHLMGGKESKKVDSYAKVLDHHRKLKKRVDDLEKKFAHGGAA